MHLSHLLGAGAALAAIGWMSATATTPSAPPTDPATHTAAPLANGHHVLVVEGDRNALTITAASHKPDPWAGAPKGFESAWRLRIADASGALLADVPLDVSPFDTDAAALLRPVRVEGCIVRSAAIGMLVNAPAFATAATYTFVRPDAAGAPAAIGTVTGAQVRELAGGGR
jgi:hypothetical protein